jgi:deoxyribodipyrimidine photo-lyase
MVAARRPGWNFALERAIELGRQLGRPLVVLEALRAGYPWASDRLHRFALEGMADNAEAFARAGVRYHAYVEPEPGAGRGLLAALAEHACAAVTDDFPAFFLPHMLSAAAPRLPVRLEAVDNNGLYPLHATVRSFPTAYAFRRHLQKELRPHLAALPRAEPLRGLDLPRAPELPAEVRRRWPMAPDRLLRGEPGALAELPIDHRVGPAPVRGGHRAGRERLASFVAERLTRYADERSDPDLAAESGLSPWLHWGHLSAHQVFEAVVAREGWTPARLAAKATGRREGWWGLSPGAESFVDELVTWRELCFNGYLRPDATELTSLPGWARATLRKHASDPRPELYSLAQLEAAQTGDRLWNAAQRQLLQEGRIHNALRMLWGKKVLEWSATPEEALARLVELNNRFALDGRDPCSWGNILWVFGKYDRAWGPERPIYGTVRYLSSANTARKLRLRGYLARYAPLGETSASGFFSSAED